MAVVELPRDRLACSELPPVCMRCGAPAVVWAEHTFWWYPRSVDRLVRFWRLCPLVLPLCLILAACYRQRVRVALPLCGRHEGHWSRRAWYTFGGLAGLPVAGAVGLLLGTSPSDEGQVLFGLFGVGWAVAAILWLVGAAVLRKTGIRLRGVSDRGITLQGVAPAFVEALRVDR